MASPRSWLLAALAVASLVPPTHSAAAPPQAAGPGDLMPLPERVEWPGGRLALDARFTVASVGAADARIGQALDRFVERLRSRTGLRLAPPSRVGRGTLIVEAREPGLPVQAATEDESYELTVTPTQARLRAPNALGVLRGLETLLQLVREDGGRHFVPGATISDRPRFAWRGLLIDPCRRWQGVEVIKRNLDGMAAVKLNVLHWHLSEDQGFRVESKVFPELHVRGSDGLFYTQDQVRDVIAYARARGIRVVPEFDMPGHATSWLVGHPELGSAPGPFALVRTWGIFDDVLDPTRDEVYAFLDRFLGEMAALFPDAYLHVGGDEVTPRAWNGNPAILDYMYRQGLSDAQDLQAHFNARVNAILTRHGKRMVGWDEVLRPELPRNIVVQSWRGHEALARAAGLGYDGVLSRDYYLDQMFAASFHYANDPIPAASVLSPEARRHILGGEACMWGEFVSPETIDSRIWPRAAAIAERLWSPPGVRDVEDMYRRLEIESGRLEAAGLTHRSNYLPMLRRIAGGGDAETLRVLADLVEPVKEYARGQLRAYTSATPLDRLVDAARPESLAARHFRIEAERWLGTPAASRDARGLRAALSLWRANHPLLEPILAASPLGAEARPLSKDLAALGELGLRALDAVEAGLAPEAAWQDAAQRALERAEKPRAEVELAVVPAVRKLVLAAQQIGALKALPAAEWNGRLDDLLKKASPPGPQDH